MRVKRVSANDVKLYNLTKVKLKTAGNTKSCPVRNLSPNEYFDKKTGEVKLNVGENDEFITNRINALYYWGEVGGISFKYG